MDYTKTVTPGIKPSFFDSEQPLTTFWKEVTSSDFEDSPITAETEFHTKNKNYFHDWDSCSLSIRGNFLVYVQKKDSKAVQYIDLDAYMYQVRFTDPNDKQGASKKYRYCLSITAQKTSVEFYNKDAVKFYKFISILKDYCILVNFRANYNVIESIGSGGYGQVRLIEEKTTKTKYAGKFMKLLDQKDKEKQKHMLINEISLLRKVSHPNIVKLHEVYESDGEICLVTELIKGQRLFDRIVGLGKLSEAETASLMKQLLLILSYLQTQGIIHRDIKPENILLSNDSGRQVLKLIDFGLATHDSGRERKKCGTAGYTAPEVLLGEYYDYRADIYSVGIVMFVCLTGRPAFTGADYKELLQENKLGIIKYRDKHWASVSAEAKALVQKILVPNPTKRIDMDEILNNKWFSTYLSKEDLKDIAEFNFGLGKADIPEEDRISDIPIFSHQHSQVSLGVPSFSVLQISGSFLTSNLGRGLNSKSTINSWYKKSRDDVEHDIFTSPRLGTPQMRGNLCDAFLRTSIVLKKGEESKPETFKYVYSIPEIPMNRQEYVGKARLKLQLLVKEPTESYDMNIANDEECGIAEKYSNLKSMEFCFGKIGRSERGPLENLEMNRHYHNTGFGTNTTLASRK